MAILLFSSVGRAQTRDPQPAAPQPFEVWLADVRAEAITRGIGSPQVLDAAFAEMQPVEQILERDRTQAEFALDLTSYLKRRLTRAHDPDRPEDARPAP